MLTLNPSSRRSQLLQALVIVFILSIAVVSTLPNYITGNWLWNRAPRVIQIDQLRDLREQGLTLPGWTTLEQQDGNIGGHRWVIQTLQPDAELDELPLQAPVILMMRPQNAQEDMPQVDWMDINGIYGWQQDQRRRLNLTFSQDPLISDQDAGKVIQVNTRFFRGWNSQRTYAVIQWYAWTDGGSPSPGDWFWADQWSQLRDRQKMPWVAVNIQIPIKPLGEIESVRAIAESITQSVQTALMTGAFSE